jgi:hypothetical protein
MRIADFHSTIVNLQSAIDTTPSWVSPTKVICKHRTLLTRGTRELLLKRDMELLEMRQMLRRESQA